MDNVGIVIVRNGFSRTIKQKKQKKLSHSKKVFIPIKTSNTFYFFNISRTNP